jgi:hypothetical protein
MFEDYNLKQKREIKPSPRVPCIPTLPHKNIGFVDKYTSPGFSFLLLKLRGSILWEIQ